MAHDYCLDLMTKFVSSARGRGLSFAILSDEPRSCLAVAVLDRPGGIRINFHVSIELVRRTTITVNFFVGLSFEPLTEIWETCRHDETRVPPELSKGNPINSMPPQIELKEIFESLPDNLDESISVATSDVAQLVGYTQRLADFLCDVALPIADRYAEPDGLMNAALNSDELEMSLALRGACSAHAGRPGDFEKWAARFLSRTGGVPDHADLHYVQCLKTVLSGGQRK